MVLSLMSERVVELLILPVLRDAEARGRYRLAAALTLLELDKINPAQVVLETFASLDADGRTALLDALAYWEDPRANVTVVRGLRQAAAEDELGWLQLCIERGCDVGTETLDRLLKSKEPELLAAGLRLVPMSAERERYTGAVDRHLFEGPPVVREAAIVAGLVLKRPSADLILKQAARDPDLPLACSLLAMLGADDDIAGLAAWAREEGAPSHAGWALGLSGRRVALDACVELVETNESALEGVRVATGYLGGASGASDWWKEHRGEFEPGTRYLEGKPFSPEELQGGLGRFPAIREELALALTIRDCVRILPTLRQLPGASVQESMLSKTE